MPSGLIANNDNAARIFELDTSRSQLPARKFLTRTEAAQYLNIGVDAFLALKIPYYNLAQRTLRWDVDEIIDFIHENKSSDATRTTTNPKPIGKRNKCKSLKEKAHRNGGRRGRAKMDSEIAEVLEFPTKKKPKLQLQAGKKKTL